MTTLQKNLVAAALFLTVGAGVYEAKQAADARAETAAGRSAQTPMAGQLRQMQSERDDATNRLAALSAELAKQKSSQTELLQLRGLAGVARRDAGELARLRSQLARQNSPSGSNLLTSAMAEAMSQAMEQQVQDKLSRMVEALRLTADQTLSISNILMKQSQLQASSMQQAFTGTFNKDELQRQALANGDPETQIKARLTPGQLADYPLYQQQEFAHTASVAANTELVQLQSTLGLTPDQLDSAYGALYSVSFDQLSGKSKPPATMTDMGEAMAWSLEQKTKALEAVLTPAQSTTYRQQQASQAKLIRQIMKQWDDSGVKQ